MVVAAPPTAKNGLPSASRLPSRRTSSPGMTTPASTAGGVQSATRSPVSWPRTRQWMPYSLPSTERVKYHQPSLRFGTERSVSWVRPLISWKMASRSGSWCAVTDSW